MSNRNCCVVLSRGGGWRHYEIIALFAEGENGFGGARAWSMCGT